MNSAEIRIISLAGDESKLNNISAQLDSVDLDIDVNVTNAVNGKTLSAYEYFSMFKSKSSKIFGRKYLSPSELGCFLSHKKAIYEFLQTDKDWLIVLEDDVSIKNEELLSLVLKRVDQLNTDALYVLGGQDGLSSFKRVLMFNEPSQFPFKKIYFGTHRWIYRTCSYMINKKIARQIFELMSANRFMTDDWGYIFSKTSSSTIYFADCFSHPILLSNSNIESERLFLKE